MKTMVLTGGGTAGHVTPNLALLPELSKNGWKAVYIGSVGGMEEGLVRDAGIPFYGVSTGKLRRYFDVKNIADPLRVVKGCFQSLRLLKELKPQAVFSKGGFVSVPVVWAARRLKIPVILHESDYEPGLANRIMKPSATYIATTFPETARAVGIKGVHVGTPVRRELLHGDGGEGLRLSGLTASLPVVLVTGGSQGAAAINQALREALPKICQKFQVIHLCGRGKYVEVKQKGYFQSEYAGEELRHYLAAASLVVARAGSNSIFEFLALRLPMLLIPLPLSASRGDQILNAKSFESQGFAHVLPQEDLTPDTLCESICAAHKQAYAMRKAMQNAPGADGVKGVINLIERL